jgi:hypothetical protein
MKINMVDEFLYVTSCSLKNYDKFFDLNVASSLNYKFISKLFSKEESKAKEIGNIYAYKFLVHCDSETNILKKLICKLLKSTCIRPCLLHAPLNPSKLYCSLILGIGMKFK